MEFSSLSEQKQNMKHVVEVGEGSKEQQHESYKSSEIFTNNREKPGYKITEEPLEHFISFGFRAAEMA